MIQHPTIAAAVAEQRRAAFMAEAEAARLARATRTARAGGSGSATGPGRWFASRRQPRHAAARRGLARLRPARAR
jgi:sarcosine oxidase gamma subunit